MTFTLDIQLHARSYKEWILGQRITSASTIPVVELFATTFIRYTYLQHFKFSIVVGNVWIDPYQY